jgi:hypothetical protein
MALETIARRKRAAVDGDTVTLGAKAYAQTFSRSEVEAQTPWIKNGISHTTLWKEDPNQVRLVRMDLISKGYEVVEEDDARVIFGISVSKLNQMTAERHALAQRVSENIKHKSPGIEETIEADGAPVSTADLF